MTVGTFKQPDYSTQTGAEYPLAIDASMRVAGAIAGQFAAHEQATPNMTVRVDPGTLWVSGAVVTQAAQNTGTITAPSTNPRIDRLVISATTGALSRIQGTEAASPSAPAIPAGNLPVAQVLLQTSTAQITNAIITDERVIITPNLGKQAIPIPATALVPRLNNGCEALNFAAGASNQPDIPYLAFDGAAKEFAGTVIRMPKSWNRGTVSAAYAWRRASGTGAANVVWGMRAVAVADNETPVANFGSDATVTDDAKTTTANFSLSGETGACTVAGSPGAGELVFFEFFRDGASGSDTLNAVDAWLTSVTLFITTDVVNDA